MVRNDIMQKLRRYCAYQERCHEEVRTKLLALKVYGEELEETISELTQEDFLNEERFAKAYAGGKFRMQKWGRTKIIRELKRRKISDYCIRKAMMEIPEADYKITMQKLITAALKKYKVRNQLITANKTAKFVISKGYESNLVWGEIKRQLED
ncbi:MAG: RecX family transcriptional regulator [Bacteroidetes bacterium]|nr:RecX family transcriptional regulator [Bacteroidota bacterium]MBK7109635.1 RecX family transcriptional regulator [Bacteroidota bacterium]MBK8487635.1 RecX family transcriptional regulator [Bacteroidota bacterium]MBK8682623.1 RecX family transcriptional regulator [Bacteroidota bacterium]